MWVNGYPLSFWPQAYITADNRMMAPAWSLAGALGGAVVYSDGGVVDVWYNNGLMEWKAGQQSYTVEGAPHSIRCAPSASPAAAPDPALAAPTIGAHKVYQRGHSVSFSNP